MEMRPFGLTGMQVGVLGFVGLCGVLRGDAGSARPLWLQDLSGIAALAGLMLAILAVNAVGGIDQLKSKIGAMDAATGAGSRLAFFPDLNSAWMPAITFFVYLGVGWWSTWYPGAEPGGGGYVAQRIFSAKNEKEGLLATLWFNIAHYALRPWPWILTGLASLILYPTLVDKETGYVFSSRGCFGLREPPSASARSQSQARSGCVDARNNRPDQIRAPVMMLQ